MAGGMPIPRPGQGWSSTRGRGAARPARAGGAGGARDTVSGAVTLPAGQDLDALAREAVTGGADALGMAGGDGSLAVVAAVAAAPGVPFVGVPGGTGQHLPRGGGGGR